MSQTIKRLSDWEPRLVAYLGEQFQRKGKIGSHDCVLFCAGAVNVMTGWAPSQKLLSYRSRKSGLQQLSDAGFESIAAYLSAHFDEVPALMAQPGDLALLGSGDGEAVAVVQGERVYAVTSDGLGLVSLTEIQRAWRVN